MTAQTHRSGSDRAAEAAEKLGLKTDDIVINIQGDQPTFDPRCLSEVISPLSKDPAVHMSTLIYKIQDPEETKDPSCVTCVFDSEDFALYFSRSPIPFGASGSVSFDFFKHLGVYAFRKHFLTHFASLPQGVLETVERLEQLRPLEYGFRIKVVETRYDSIEVDTELHVQMAEAVLK